MKVRQYMTSDVVTANLGDGLRQTFYRMRERDIHHMPVLDDEERLVGIISDRDLRRPDWVDDEQNVAHYYLLDNAHKVADTMTQGPEAVSPDDDIQTAVGALLKRKIGALPVVTEDGRLAGILSAVDLLRAFHERG
jgi:acetoin utilization protein AcuB